MDTTRERHTCDADIVGHRMANITSLAVNVRHAAWRCGVEQLTCIRTPSLP